MAVFTHWPVSPCSTQLLSGARPPTGPWIAMYTCVRMRKCERWKAHLSWPLACFYFADGGGLHSLPKCP